MADDQAEFTASKSPAFSAVTTQFAAYLNASGCSPNTTRAYDHDLTHFHSFLVEQGLDWRALTLARAVDLLVYLRGKPSRRRGAVQHPSLAAVDGESTVAHLGTATINRVLAAVSSFYEWARIAKQFDGPNPIARVVDRTMARVTDRHIPFLAGISRQQPSRRAPRVRTVHRLPRSLEADQVERLLGALRCRRDLALIHLMLDGGLRPGEVLGLYLDDISYGRRRVTVRYREDHPRGVRQKSRTDRIVDLHEAATLAAVSSYIPNERPAEAETTLVFLVGGKGLAGASRSPMLLSCACSLGPVRERASGRLGLPRTVCATLTRRACGRGACGS